MLADVSKFRSQAKDEMTMRSVALPNVVADASIFPHFLPSTRFALLVRVLLFLGLASFSVGGHFLVGHLE